MTSGYEKIFHIDRIEKCEYGERSIKLQMDRSVFAEIVDKWTDSFALLDGFEVDADPKKDILEKQVKRAKSRIVQSYLTTEFLEEFKDELSRDDPAKMITELTAIIGIPDKNEKNATFQKKFQEMSRRSENSEKFSVFLTRLTNVASKLSCDEKVQSYLVEQQFQTGLTPEEKSFVVIHGNPTDTSKQQAALLDLKKQYIVKTNVNLISKDQTSDFERTQLDVLDIVSKLSERVIAMESKSKGQLEQPTERDPLAELINQVSYLTSEVGQVLRVGQSDYVRGNSRGSGRGRGSSRGTFRGRGRSTPEPRKNYDVTCGNCGIKGHHENDCYGKFRRCHKCGVMGHTMNSPKFHPLSEKN